MYIVFYSSWKSAGKRLTPTTVVGNGYASNGYSNLTNEIQIGNERFVTNEVLQDDGTYGSSAEYIYWKDIRGAFHQHFILSGQIIHLSDYPMAWPKIIMNLETQKIREFVYVKKDSIN